MKNEFIKNMPENFREFSLSYILKEKISIENRRIEKKENVKKMKKVIINQNRVLLFALLVVILIMGIGYASIESITGEIEGKVIANAQEGILITEVENVSNIDANTENSKIQNFVKTTLQSTVELSSTNPLSSITYKVTVYNSSKEMNIKILRQCQ